MAEGNNSLLELKSRRGCIFSSLASTAGKAGLLKCINRGEERDVIVLIPRPLVLVHINRFVGQINGGYGFFRLQSRE